MIDNISFLNQNWFWQVAIISLVIWFVFIWKEQKRAWRKKLYLNSVVAFISLISLALIALKPASINPNKLFKAAIITQDYNETQLDSLKKIHQKLTVYNYHENRPLIPKGKRPETVFILGNGLKQYDLWKLDSINTIYIGGKTPKGISDFKYKIQNTVGNDAVFIGRYLQPKIGSWLFLEDPAGKALDSIKLTDTRFQDFQLATSLKVKGEFVYQLVEKDSLSTVINKDPLPLIIKEKKQLQVLIVNAMPTFETKYLKNYLAESGHKVVVQSRLTKNRYKYEYFNLDEKPTISFSNKQLKPYDLVIIDFQTLNSLSNNAKNALKTSVNENGLGIFIQPEIAFYHRHNQWYSFNFNRNKKSKTYLDIDTKKAITKFPYSFKKEIFIEPIFTDQNNDIITAYKRIGMGRIGTSALQNTYELQLKGSSKIYKQIWAKTIENISRKDVASIDWYSNSTIAYKNEPFNFQLRTNIESPYAVTKRDHQIALKQDINIESLWTGTTYPKETGWKKLMLKKDSTTIFKYYITENSNWQSVKTANIIKANKKHFNNKNKNLSSGNGLNKSINPLWFFVLFIVSIGYLWLEPKL